MGKYIPVAKWANRTGPGKRGKHVDGEIEYLMSGQDVRKMIVYVDNADARRDIRKLAKSLGLFPNPVEWNGDGSSVSAFEIVGDPDKFKRIREHPSCSDWHEDVRTRVTTAGGATSNDAMSASAKRAVAYTKCSKAERLASEETIRRATECDSCELADIEYTEAAHRLRELRKGLADNPVVKWALAFGAVPFLTEKNQIIFRLNGQNATFAQVEVIYRSTL